MTAVLNRLYHADYQFCEGMSPHGESQGWIELGGWVGVISFF